MQKLGRMPSRGRGAMCLQVIRGLSLELNALLVIVPRPLWARAHRCAAAHFRPPASGASKALLSAPPLHEKSPASPTLASLGTKLSHDKTRQGFGPPHPRIRLPAGRPTNAP